MDRDLHKKYIPICPSQTALVDQYMWDVKDSTIQQCYNGISRPIYDFNGNLSFTLPLDMYPQVNQIHPHVTASTIRPNLNLRVPYPPKGYRLSGRYTPLLTRAAIGVTEADNRLEGMYNYTHAPPGYYEQFGRRLYPTQFGSPIEVMPHVPYPV